MTDAEQPESSESAESSAARSAEPLTAGALVPHFDLVDVDGRRRRYADDWQKRLLALVLLPEAESAASRAYQESLADIAPALAEMNTALVVAAAPVEGLAPPGWLVADQFGEIQYLSGTGRLPARAAGEPQSLTTGSHRASRDDAARGGGDAEPQGTAVAAPPQDEMPLPAPDEVVQWVRYVRTRCG